ncbi:hypothetical protein [Sandaracinus amylolyticus]|uniref:Uncharacterized protein n=1 Tax=Sandaracinus amylolyticus TaxID=927083 RepID=A0A0F6YGY1_9BACT|nr:hypothetical protein [Sandaracinus amylolyticus]AKF05210.1 hypothetical protein DB32_002359 [Sandaracinus amylolyticus]
MSDSPLPPCGLYVTRAPIGSVPAGRLVYFHDHGDPGPGVYLPTRWVANKARFDAPGTLLPSREHAVHLEPLPHEGFYRVADAFFCCEKRCRRFENDLLVQLGYDGAGTPILFVPEMSDGAIGVPDRGTKIDRDRIAHLAPLRVQVASAPRDRTFH